MEDDVTKDLAEFSLANAIFAALTEGHACEQSARYVSFLLLLPPGIRGPAFYPHALAFLRQLFRILPTRIRPPLSLACRSLDVLSLRAVSQLPFQPHSASSNDLLTLHLPLAVPPWTTPPRTPKK